MPVVSDSSPLILFAKSGRLDLLRSLYGEVLIPPAVHREVVEQAPNKPGSAEVASARWITAAAVAPPTGVLAQRALGAGETEAIALAKARGLTLLIDDPAGRAAAREEGVPVAGCAGVLLAAKRGGLLDTARPHLDALVAAGLRLDDVLYRRLLELAGEAPPS